jgi:hypothetical protein
MGLLDKLWDDSVAGPQPDHGLGRLRKHYSWNSSSTSSDSALARRRTSAEFAQAQDESRQVTQSIAIVKPSALKIDQNMEQKDATSSSSPPMSPSLASPSSFSPSPRGRENVWRSVFHPGSNQAMSKVGSSKFDKPEPNSPTVYDWLYSGETKSEYR